MALKTYSSRTEEETVVRPHPRRIGWIVTSSLALGGSNLSLYMISGLISGQGSAGILMLIFGILVSWLAIPCWTELMLLYPSRVGGIAAFTGAALKPYNPILAALNGIAYWSCTVVGINFSAVFFATAIQHWFYPDLSINLLATGMILFFTLLNVTGIQWIGRFVVPFAILALFTALLSGLIPIFFGDVQWVRTLSFNLKTPFPGIFGQITSIMAGIYLVSFSARLLLNKGFVMWVK